MTGGETPPDGNRDGDTGKDPGAGGRPDREATGDGTVPTPTDAVPAVGAVVVREDGGEEVLLVRDRAREAWMVPFGRVEPGESVRATVRRELREEADVAVTVDRLAGVYSDPETQVFEHRSGSVLHFVTTLVVCSPVAADPTPTPDGEEVDAARFRPVGELPPMPPVGDWVRDALADTDPVLR